MKRFIAVLFGLPIFALMAAFALANRKWVMVSFDPITPDQPLYSVEAPLWAVLFTGILLGLIAGGVATWLKQGKWRRRARQAIYELEDEKVSKKKLEEELNKTREATSAILPAPSARAS